VERGTIKRVVDRVKLRYPFYLSGLICSYRCPNTRVTVVLSGRRMAQVRATRDILFPFHITTGRATYLHKRGLIHTYG
jgi:hypothetical protein